MPRTVLLIDGNSLTYRAFFALPTDLATASGQVTNAVFGFTSMLDQHHPDQAARRHRRRLRPARAHLPARADPRPTRATATPRPTSSASRWGSCARSSSRSGSRSSRSPAFEADDVIATLATQGRDAGDRRHRRHRRPRRLPARGGPAREGPLQQARRVGLRATTTRPASRSAPASPPRSTRSTPRSAATRPTTCRACPGWGRRRPPSSSPPTAGSTASSSTSTSRRRSSARTSPPTRPTSARTTR